MGLSPRVVTEDVVFQWDGVTARLPKGQVIDVAPGSALEEAIGAHRLVPHGVIPPAEETPPPPQEEAPQPPAKEAPPEKPEPESKPAPAKARASAKKQDDGKGGTS
jgi:hypothetical protein